MLCLKAHLHQCQFIAIKKFCNEYCTKVLCTEDDVKCEGEGNAIPLFPQLCNMYLSDLWPWS